MTRRQVLFARRPESPAISIASACLARNGISCRSCEDACDNQAIRFAYQQGGFSHPTIDTSACTACGDCLTVCPAGAIGRLGDQGHG